MLESEVFFCEKCGRRLSNEDLAEGRVRRSGKTYFCTRCPATVEKRTEPRRRRPSGRMRATGPQPRASHGAQTTWVLIGAGAAAVIVAVVFIRFSRSPRAAPRPPRGEESREDPPPEVEAPEGPRALFGPRRLGPRRSDDEEFNPRLEGARDAYNAALKYRSENPTDMQGYIKRLFIVLERYGETTYAEEAKKVLPEPIPGERMWWVTSGFDNADQKSFSRAFPPEESPASIDTSASYECKEGTARWKEITAREYDGYFDMLAEFGHEYVVGYAFTYLHSDGEQAALIGVGSDDGVKVWLNGEVVHEADIYRGWKRDEDEVAVKLRPGANPFLLKIVQGHGGYAFSATVLRAESYVRFANRR